MIYLPLNVPAYMIIYPKRTSLSSRKNFSVFCQKTDQHRAALGGIPEVAA
jgi:hypothetical protein